MGFVSFLAGRFDIMQFIYLLVNINAKQSNAVNTNTTMMIIMISSSSAYRRTEEGNGAMTDPGFWKAGYKLVGFWIQGPTESKIKVSGGTLGSGFQDNGVLSGEPRSKTDLLVWWRKLPQLLTYFKFHTRSSEKGKMASGSAVPRIRHWMGREIWGREKMWDTRLICTGAIAHVLRMLRCWRRCTFAVLIQADCFVARPTTPRSRRPRWRWMLAVSSTSTRRRFPSLPHCSRYVMPNDISPTLSMSRAPC